MNPQPNIYSQKFLIWLAGGVGAVIVIITIVAILLVPNYAQYKLHQLPFTSDQNFTELVGEDLYSFNGLAFYKYNLHNQQVTTLNDGIKLPTPEYVYWGNDNGALINFASSFGRTNVAEELEKRSEFADDYTMGYTWYYDFSDSSLRLVNEMPVHTGLASYSAEENGFYYLPDFSGVEVVNPLATPLHFYDLDTHKNKVVSEDINAVDITYLGDCPRGELRVCFIARNPEDLNTVRLAGLNKEDDNITELLSSNGRLLPTNDPLRFVTTSQPETSSIEEEVEYATTPVTIHNVADGSKREAGFSLANETASIGFVDTDSFYVLTSGLSDTVSEGTYLSGAANMLGNLSTKDYDLELGDNTYTTGFIGTADYGQHGRALMTSMESQQLLFTPINDQLKITKLEQNTVDQVVKDCVEDHARNYQYFEEASLYKVFFTDNNTFEGNVASFSSCVIDKDSQALVGYNFYFGGLSPVNGRITTD